MARYVYVSWMAHFYHPPSLNKEFSGTITVKNRLLLTATIVVLYRWPTWWRNTPFGQGGRVYYGNTNIDVNPVGFVVQESLGFVVALLVAVVWLKWSAYYRQIKTQISSMSNENPIGEALKPENSEELSHMFFHWQVASVLLTLAFLWYTVFFRQMVISVGDSRYLPHAIIVHSMWVITWVIISLPVLITSYQWHNMHARAMVALAKADLPKEYDPDRLAGTLDKLQPISSWNVAASGVAVATSFLVPFIKNVFH